MKIPVKSITYNYKTKKITVNNNPRVEEYTKKYRLVKFNNSPPSANDTIH